MHFYLKWLDRYERQPDESSLIGFILCTKTSRDQIELAGTAQGRDRRLRVLDDAPAQG